MTWARLSAGVTTARFGPGTIVLSIPQANRPSHGVSARGAGWISGSTPSLSPFLLECSPDSKTERDKYYNADGTDSELGKAANAKVESLFEGMQKLGTVTADVCTDWLVH